MSAYKKDFKNMMKVVNGYIPRLQKLVAKYDYKFSICGHTLTIDICSEQEPGTSMYVYLNDEPQIHLRIQDNEKMARQCKKYFNVDHIPATQENFKTKFEDALTKFEEALEHNAKMPNKEAVRLRDGLMLDWKEACINDGDDWSWGVELTPDITGIVYSWHDAILITDGEETTFEWVNNIVDTQRAMEKIHIDYIAEKELLNETE